MKTPGTKNGFTLIEVIVVVVIIGILAGIILPQYRSVVEKSILAEATPVLKAIADAALLYYLQYRVWEGVPDAQLVWATNTTAIPASFSITTGRSRHWAFDAHNHGGTTTTHVEAVSPTREEYLGWAGMEMQVDVTGRIYSMCLASGGCGQNQNNNSWQFE